jgi:hypothetical protein
MSTTPKGGKPLGVQTVRGSPPAVHNSQLNAVELVPPRDSMIADWDTRAAGLMAQPTNVRNGHFGAEAVALALIPGGIRGVPSGSEALEAERRD